MEFSGTGFYVLIAVVVLCLCSAIGAFLYFRRKKQNAQLANNEESVESNTDDNQEAIEPKKPSMWQRLFGKSKTKSNESTEQEPVPVPVPLETPAPSGETPTPPQPAPLETPAPSGETPTPPQPAPLETPAPSGETPTPPPVPVTAPTSGEAPPVPVPLETPPPVPTPLGAAPTPPTVPIAPTVPNATPFPVPPSVSREQMLKITKVTNRTSLDAGKIQQKNNLLGGISAGLAKPLRKVETKVSPNIALANPGSGGLLTALQNVADKAANHSLVANPNIRKPSGGGVVWSEED
jgi:hypothetical protein